MPRLADRTTIRVTVRVPARLRVTAPLARPLVGAKGVGRFRRKLARPLFTLVHQRLGFRARARLVAANGAAFDVDCANTAFLEYASRIDAAGGFEPEVGGLLTHLAPRLRVVYDIGANWGYFPLLLGTTPEFQGNVHAFEIRPRTAADLRGILDGAGLEERVMVHPFGLSDQEGTVRLSREAHSYLVRIVDAGARRATEPATVRRLDTLDLTPPDLMKIDVEGHEASVLRGARRVLEQNRPLIVFESWHNGGDPTAMLEPLTLLRDLGYRLYRLEWRAFPDPSGPSRDERRGEIDIVPLAPADRVAIAGTLNLLAAHPRQSPSLLEGLPRSPI